VVQDQPGFWINRILGPYVAEAGHLLLDGARIDVVDRLMVEWGFPVGPFTVADQVGLDVAEKVAGVLQAAFGERMTPAAPLAALVKAGRFGRKAGRGFYRYQGGRTKGVDESVYALVSRQPNGGDRPAEIVQRLVLPMLNEAARAVGEGVVRSPRDGDIGAIFGFGFPPFRGGPLRHADDLGASRLVDDLQRLSDRLGPRFAPCDALRDMARRDARFYPG
jgi:3-hydroxyacyl-CoA dehydrogenase/enoyl-CoA hydratase/3-hydroxybutyryl-CoA epimerase